MMKCCFNKKVWYTLGGVAVAIFFFAPKFKAWHILKFKSLSFGCLTDKNKESFDVAFFWLVAVGRLLNLVEVYL